MDDGDASSEVPRRDDLLAPGAGWSAILERGARLRIVDVEGRQGVDFLCYNADDPQERYNAPNTIKAQQKITLQAGTVLFSDRARPMASVVEDTCGGHDTIGGCCSAPSNRLLYGVEGVRGCRENFVDVLACHNLGWRDIVPNVNFFCHVPVQGDGGLARSVFVEGSSRGGDHVDLRAEMRLLVVISNCPQVNNPCNDGNPSPVRLLVYDPVL